MDLSKYLCYVCNKGFNPYGGYALDLQLEEATEEEILMKIRHISCKKEQGK